MILSPTKYTDIELSILGISYEIIRVLKLDNSLKLTQVYRKLILKLGEGAKENFVLALCFLYSLDVINYNEKFDILELK